MGGPGPNPIVGSVASWWQSSLWLSPSSEEEKKEDTDAIVAATVASPGPRVVGIRPYEAKFAGTVVARGTVLAVPVVARGTVLAVPVVSPTSVRQ